MRFIWSLLQGGANLGCAYVKGFHELSGRFERQRLDAALGEVELGSRENGESKAGELRDVGRQLAQRR